MWFVASEANLRRSALSASLRDVICFVRWVYKASFFYVFYCNTIFFYVKSWKLPSILTLDTAKRASFHLFVSFEILAWIISKISLESTAFVASTPFFRVCRSSRDSLKPFVDSRSFSQMKYFGFSLFFSRNPQKFE